MSLISCAAVMQPAGGVILANDIGLVAGLYPDATDSPEALLAAVVAAPPERRSLAWLAFARSLYARGYPDAAELVPMVCEDCGGSQPRMPQARLLIADRAVLAGNASTARDIERDPGLRADTRVGDRIARQRAAIANFNLGWSLSRWGEFAAAEPLQRDALAVLQATLSSGDVRLAAVKLGVARTALGLGRRAEALLLIAEVLTIGDGTSHLTADALTLRARAQRAAGDPVSAEASIRRAIAIGVHDAEARGRVRISPSTIDAAIARIGEAGVAASNIDVEDLATLKGAITSSSPTLFDNAEGQRLGLLAQVLLDRGIDAEALATARAAVTKAPADATAALALGLAELRAGIPDVARLADIASVLDEQGWGPGSGSPDIIAARMLLSRLYGDARIAAAWVQARQGAMGAQERLQGNEGGEDIERASIAFRGVFREKIRLAWVASDRAPPSWPADQRRFSIYFDVDRYEITPSAMPALERAAALWRTVGGRIVLSGNLDEMGGTREYALALSDRLAGAAKQQLEALGVPAQAVTTIAFGKERPLVRPREGRVAERRNRRVDIDLLPAAGR